MLCVFGQEGPSIKIFLGQQICDPQWLDRAGEGEMREFLDQYEGVVLCLAHR